MENVKIKDEVIQKLIAEVEKRAKDAEAYELLLGMLKNIYSMNQLRGLVVSNKEFENKFRSRYRYLEDDDIREFTAELFNFLNVFIKNNSSFGKSVNIAVTSELSDSKFLEISGLSKVDISSEVLEALKKTAANTVGTDLALQNPCCKPSNLVENFFGSVSIIEIMQLMADADGRASVVLDKLGIKNSSNPGHRKLFGALSKSLSPALVEYSTSMVRVAVVDGVTDNLYSSNASLKRKYVSMQLVSFVDWFIRHPKANYVFGEISKDELIFKKLSVYTDNFSNEQLMAYEEQIYGEKIQGYYRVKLEYLDLLHKLSKFPEKYAKYIDVLEYISTSLKVVVFDPTVLSEISKEIVRINNIIVIILFFILSPKI